MTMKMLAQALACASILGAAAAQAALPVDPVRLSTPRPAAVKVTARVPAAPASAPIDQTPPRLKSFSLKVSGDVSHPLAQLGAEFQATDDVSGVTYAALVLQGPHGQEFNIGPGNDWLPARTLRQAMATDANAYMEPGAWTAVSMTLWDEAGNAASFDADQLATLGNATVQVVNARADLVDVTAPTVVAGRIATPVVSASGHPTGTDGYPLVGAVFTVADTGSGVGRANGTWCLQDMSSCFGIVGIDTVRGEHRAAVQVVGALYSPPPTGNYLLYMLQAVDQAGNARILVGSDFGGATDFSTLFPGGSSITITP